MTSAADSRGVGAPDVPGLIGERWLKFLDGRWGKTEFSAGLGRQLLAAPYARPNSIERATALELTGLCRDWLAAQPTAMRSRQT
jgi:hypothetical protein